MNRHYKITGIFVIVVSVLVLSTTLSCGQGNGSKVTVTGDSVVVATKHIDYRFSRVEAFSGMYMIFGGIYMPPECELWSATISGLNIKDARDISKTYPDFYMCKSPGASLAQAHIIHLKMIPLNSRIKSILKDALDAYKANLAKSDGEQVCLQLEGLKIKMESAVVREVGEDVKSQYPDREYYLITSAKQVSGKEALEGN